MGNVAQKREALEQGTIIKNVHFFNQVEGLSEQTISLLNSKIMQVTEQYNERMAKLNARNYELFEQFNKLKILTGESFQELNIETLLKKAIFISTDAREIWDILNKESPGFFTSCI
jgi:uncharacterized protein YlzI (FlbEa/FlbD family)